MKTLLVVLIVMTTVLAESCQGDRMAEGDTEDLLLVKKETVCSFLVFVYTLFQP
jgi:hypothetical protein